MYYPDKRAWSAKDHYVRFIVTVFSDGIYKGLWPRDDGKKSEIEIVKAVYEALIVLRVLISTLMIHHRRPRSDQFRSLRICTGCR